MFIYWISFLYFRWDFTILDLFFIAGGVYAIITVFIDFFILPAIICYAAIVAQTITRITNLLFTTNFRALLSSLIISPVNINKFNPADAATAAPVQSKEVISNTSQKVIINSPAQVENKPVTFSDSEPKPTMISKLNKSVGVIRTAREGYGSRIGKFYRYNPTLIEPSKLNPDTPMTGRIIANKKYQTYHTLFRENASHNDIKHQNDMKKMGFSLKNILIEEACKSKTINVPDILNEDPDTANVLNKLGIDLPAFKRGTPNWKDYMYDFALNIIKQDRHIEFQKEFVSIYPETFPKTSEAKIIELNKKLNETFLTFNYILTQEVLINQSLSDKDIEVWQKENKEYIEFILNNVSPSTRFDLQDTLEDQRDMELED